MPSTPLPKHSFSQEFVLLFRENRVCSFYCKSQTFLIQSAHSSFQNLTKSSKVHIFEFSHLKSSCHRFRSLLNVYEGHIVWDKLTSTPFHLIFSLQLQVVLTKSPFSLNSLNESPVLFLTCFLSIYQKHSMTTSYYFLC